MPETSHQQGARSFVDAVPGSAIAAVLVALTKGTKHQLDLGTAVSVVAVASWASSYVIAYLRHTFKRVNSALAAADVQTASESVMDQAVKS